MIDEVSLRVVPEIMSIDHNLSYDVRFSLNIYIYLGMVWQIYCKNKLRISLFKFVAKHQYS